MTHHQRPRTGKFPANDGQSLLEYALLLVLVAALTTGALAAAGVSLDEVFDTLVCRIRGETCTTLLTDEFDSLDLESWQIIKGKWEIRDGKLCAGPGRGQIFRDIPGEDYAINLEGVNLSKGKGYGVFFRSSDTKKVDGYTFQVDPGYRRGSFLFRTWVRGNELPPLAESPAPSYDWYIQDHTVRVEVSGDTFTAYMDGEQVLQGQDATYAAGGLGLRTWDGTQVCFDRISVEALR